MAGCANGPGHSLTGFATATREVRIVTGEDVEVDLTMRISRLEETVVVRGAISLVTHKRRGTATTIAAEEMQAVPNPRDPWGNAT